MEALVVLIVAIIHVYIVAGTKGFQIFYRSRSYDILMISCRKACSHERAQPKDPLYHKIKDNSEFITEIKLRERFKWVYLISVWYEIINHLNKWKLKLCYWNHRFLHDQPKLDGAHTQQLLQNSLQDWCLSLLLVLSPNAPWIQQTQLAMVPKPVHPYIICLKI